jgi:hypothetical protein
MQTHQRACPGGAHSGAGGVGSALPRRRRGMAGGVNGVGGGVAGSALRRLGGALHLRAGTGRSKMGRNGRVALKGGID